VTRRNGSDVGKITAITPLDVTIEKSGVSSKIPVEEIRGVTFFNEPRELNVASHAIAAGRYETALETLRRIKAADLPAEGVRRDGVVAEVEFMKAQCDAGLAMSGRAEVSQADQSLRKFRATHSRSFHVPEAIELLGNLYDSTGRYDAARGQFEQLAKAKTPYFVARAAVLVGRTFQEEGAHDQAVTQFDKALSTRDRSPTLESVRLDATLAKAVSEAALGKLDGSAARIVQLIAAADGDDVDFLARTYNALGDCYLQAGRDKDALFAFLHVDLLYGEAQEEHAKSLHELSSLWKTAGYADRAADSADRLADKYPGSRWNKH